MRRDREEMDALLSRIWWRLGDVGKAPNVRPPTRCCFSCLGAESCQVTFRSENLLPLQREARRKPSFATLSEAKACALALALRFAKGSLKHLEAGIFR